MKRKSGTLIKRKSAAMMLMVGLLAAAAAACGNDEPEPAAINPAVDKCDLCNMQVGDDGFATQLLTKEGRVYKFDDIGCMFAWKRDNAGAEIVIEFVRDHYTREWIKLESAFFAYDPSFSTPMAYGLVSFKDEASARKFIETEGKGRLMSAADLKSHTWERNPGGMEHGHGGGARGEEGQHGGHGGNDGGKQAHNNAAHAVTVIKVSRP